MDSIKIKLAENGFVIEYEDPAITKKNSKKDARWEDPEVYRVYETQDALLADLAILIPKLAGSPADKADEFQSAFNEATSEAKK